MIIRLCVGLMLASSLFSAKLAAQSSPEPAAESGRQSQTAQTPAGSADDEAQMIAAAVAEAEQAAPRLGASVGFGGGRSFRAPYARGLGVSVALTGKMENPRGLGQIGIIGWPSALYRGPAQAEERFESLEMFLGASLFPFTLGPVDFGFYLLLAGTRVASDTAGRAALGATVQWSFDRVWALRYQLGVSTGTNLVNAGLDSTLAIDMVFPYI